jgi:hypothetical protein
VFGCGYAALCQEWGGVEEGSKWNRLSEKEIQRAIERVQKLEAAKKPTALNFQKPPVIGGDYDFVIAGRNGHWDGLFPRGGVSLVGGSSGAGKSSLLLPLLRDQVNGDPVLDRLTFKLPYMLMLQDRGSASLRRTARRLGIDLSTTPYELVDRGGNLAQFIADVLDKTNPTPAVIFFEGLDLATDDASKMSTVANTISAIQKVVSRYHVALIGSVGAPKMKPREKYENMRDRFFGSCTWGRMAETMVYINAEPDEARTVLIMPRDSAQEKLTMRFNLQGRLEIRKSVEPPTDERSLMLQWIQKQEAFTVAEFAKQFAGVHESTIKRRLAEFEMQGAIASGDVVVDGRKRKLYQPITITEADVSSIQ